MNCMLGIATMGEEWDLFRKWLDRRSNRLFDVMYLPIINIAVGTTCNNTQLVCIKNLGRGYEFVRANIWIGTCTESLGSFVYSSFGREASLSHRGYLQCAHQIRINRAIEPSYKSSYTNLVLVAVYCVMLQWRVECLKRLLFADLFFVA